MRRIAGVTVAASLLAMVAVAPSVAAPRQAVPRPGSFDGLWSVAISTQYGPCDPSYRYPARIVGSQVLQADNSYDYQISGVVTKNGGISVTVSRNGQSAVGYGHLSRTTGGGWWQTTRGQCSGTWTATKRN